MLLCALSVKKTKKFLREKGQVEWLIGDVWPDQVSSWEQRGLLRAVETRMVAEYRENTGWTWTQAGATSPPVHSPPPTASSTPAAELGEILILDLIFSFKELFLCLQPPALGPSHIPLLKRRPPHDSPGPLFCQGCGESVPLCVVVHFSSSFLMTQPAPSPPDAHVLCL